jgi:hypothetical protein
MKSSIDAWCARDVVLFTWCLVGCSGTATGSLPSPFIVDPSPSGHAAPSAPIVSASAGTAAAPVVNPSATPSVTPPVQNTPQAGASATPVVSAGMGAAGSGGARAGASGMTGGGGLSGSAAGSNPSAAGSGQAGTSAGAGGTTSGASATPCMLSVDFTSVGSHGMWYPHNIGAVWVEDTAGHFVKTIERWAGIRAGYLAAWNMRESQHGKWPSCPFANSCTGMMVPDQVDVKTQATIFVDKQAHHVTWNCKDLDGKVVADGKYKMFFEEMENIYPLYPAGPLATVEFEKGTMPATIMPPDTSPFSGLKIVITPAP